MSTPDVNQAKLEEFFERNPEVKASYEALPEDQQSTVRIGLSIGQSDQEIIDFIEAELAPPQGADEIGKILCIDFSFLDENIDTLIADLPKD